MKLPPITTPDGRRAYAFMAILGGAVVMTAYAVVVLYMVRHFAGFIFWLGIAAHVQIFAALTGLIALFVKRTIKVGRDGLEVTDANKEPDE